MGTPAVRHFSPINFKTRFRSLDGIRALAVLMVFVGHYGGGDSHGSRLVTIIQSITFKGWIGVHLFFVLSGFLITGILFDTRDDSRFFQRFFARRSLRIFPVFYLSLFVLLLLTPIFHYQWHWLQLTYVFYIGNFFGSHSPDLPVLWSANHPAAVAYIGHFWSLCVEEQFYLLWPATIWLVRDRLRLLWLASFGCVVALLLRCAVEFHYFSPAVESWSHGTLPLNMDSLFVGGIVALLLRGPHADRWQRSSRLVFLISTALLLVVFALSARYTLAWTNTIGLTFTALAGAGLLGSTLRSGSPAYRLFGLRPLMTLGRYSYGFYVFHLIFFAGWKHFRTVLIDHGLSLTLSQVIMMAVNFAATFLVCQLSYNLFEVRILRFKKHFEYDSELSTHRHAFQLDEPVS